MKLLRAILLVALCGTSQAQAQDVPRAGAEARRVEAAFGPDGEAEALILKTIGGSKSSIRLAWYAFSSPAIVDALVAARRRGVDVRVLVDRKHNVDDDQKGIGRKALDALARAGIPARTNGRYRLLHDKFMVIDAQHVQTGSYNYAASANQNSENVLVIWNDPALAAKYLAHWQSRFDAGTDHSAR